MAQSNFEERIDTYEIESTNVMTGDRDRSRYLYYQLKMSMAKAKQIDIIVSFLMESGVRMLLNDMKRALDRGVKIRILTGNYLGITQPSALYLIKSELGDRVDLRLYNETSRSFHPKSYIFHYESSNEIYIGSSNISKSALTSGIEWNYRFSDTLDKKNYELFYATFEDLFLNHSILIDDEELKRYSKAWKKPAVSRDLAKYDAIVETILSSKPGYKVIAGILENFGEKVCTDLLKKIDLFSGHDNDKLTMLIKANKSKRLVDFDFSLLQFIPYFHVSNLLSKQEEQIIMNSAYELKEAPIRKILLLHLDELKDVLIKTNGAQPGDTQIISVIEEQIKELYHQISIFEL